MVDVQSPAAGQPENSGRSSFIRVFARALGVTFLSVLSLLVAFYAFASLPQVQDLFFDVRPSAMHGVAYWIEFYVLMVLVWAAPLAFTARLLLLQNFEAIGVDSEKRFKWIVLGLPNAYLLLTSIAVFIGLINAVDDLPSPTRLATGVCPTDKPVLGVCAEAPLGAYLHTHLLILLGASIAAVLLLAFRNLLVRNYYRNVQRREKTRSGYFHSVLSRYEKLSRRHGGCLTDESTYLLSLKPDWMSESVWIASQRAKVFMCWYLLIFMGVFSLVILLHYLSYSDAASAFFVKMGLSPSGWLATVLEPLSIRRASFIPVALGAWVPFVSFLALLSNRFQFPIIASIVVITAGLTFVLGDGHDARLVSARQDAPDMTLEQAVKAWKAANGCGGEASAALCPRPIIASGEGGGSRAAYLMASALGHLEDLSIDGARNQTGRRFSQQLFGISAVSGSSVGAALYLGALRVHDQADAAAVKEGVYAQNLFFLNIVNPGQKFLQGCVTYKDTLQAILSNDFVSPAVAGFLARDLPTLSRLPYVLDRAGVLESSWESAFASVYGATAENPLQAPLKTFQAGAMPQSATGRPVTKSETGSACGEIAPQSGWTPILFANSTSGETGRRVILSPIDWKDHGRPDRDAFSDSYDFDELVCSAQPQRSFLDAIAAYLPYKFSPVTRADCDPATGKMRGLDVRLSTAASVSSRAPFVTPHATVRDQNGRAIDSLVDGGYFDNSGAVTAYELSRAIKRIDPSLEPFVLQVTSEPGWFGDSDNCEQENRRFTSRKAFGRPTLGAPQLPYQSNFKFSGALGDALTVNNTRIARGFETLVEMPARMEQLNGKDANGSYAEVYVCPQRKRSGFSALARLVGAPVARRPSSLRGVTQERLRLREAGERAARKRVRSWKEVSLSWWLSPPLQAYLDGQVYADHNAEAFRGVLALLGSQEPEKPQP